MIEVLVVSVGALALVVALILSTRAEIKKGTRIDAEYYSRWREHDIKYQKDRLWEWVKIHENSAKPSVKLI